MTAGRRLRRCESQVSSESRPQSSLGLALFISVLTFFAVILQSGCSGIASGNTTATPNVEAAASARLAVNPAVITFGNVPVGSAGNQSMNLTNSGNVAVTISRVTLSGADFSLQSASFPLTLDPGSSISLALSFAPAATGNAVGTASIASAQLTAPLTVQAVGTGMAVAPAITGQSVSQSVPEGQTATFSVTASGTAPLSYQWLENGIAIGGATSSSYTTPAETTSASGSQFTVLVSNTAGTVTSSPASLTVVPPPSPLLPSTSTLTFGNVNLGGSDTLSVTLTNTGASNVTISRVSIAGAGFSASGLSAGSVVTPGGTATLNAVFAPAATGGATGSIMVVSDASNSPASVTLSGTGVEPSHSASLAWNPSTSTVVGYSVYRGIVSGGPYSKIGSSVGATTSFTDTTVEAGQTYYWVVTALDSSNVESTYSNEVSGTTPTP